MDAKLLEAMLEDRFNLASGKALRDIDALAEHLAELRRSVVAWTAGESARSPDPYGNAFGDAATSVVAFREAAVALGTLRRAD
jgi:hypothetical protein